MRTTIITAISVACLSSQAIAATTLKQKIAKRINARTDAISLKPFHGMQLVKQRYFADGQVQYYIFMKNGTLLNPLKFTLAVKTQLTKTFGDQALYLANNEPTFKCRQPACSITFALTVRNQCVACETLGVANIHYTLNNNTIHQSVDTTRAK